LRFARILVTGGAGFIGSHLVRRLLTTHPGCEIVVLDALTYAGRRQNLADVEADPRFRFVHGSIANADDVAVAAAGCDAIVNVAAETHVDRSIFGGDEFLVTNVIGTKRLLDWSRDAGGIRYLQVSTDEVYGDVPEPIRSREGDSLAGSSPYAASKSAGDLLVLSYARTFGVPASITRGSNTYGPFQFPEKLIPLFATNALDGLPMPIYGDGRQVREMLHVDDHCAAIDLVLHRGGASEVYNVGSESAQANIDTAEAILAATGADRALLTYVADRPGHDRRYALDCTKVRALGWRQAIGFEEGLRRTVDWFAANRAWWEPIKTGAEFGEYATKNYGDRP
jgi:dTDP-glucose 4,6-dehydratase